MGHWVGKWQAMERIHAHSILFSVITYTILCGYQPFQAEDNVELMDDITHARYEFHERYWANVSSDGKPKSFYYFILKCNIYFTIARSFIKKCLALNPADRPTATEALNDVWMTGKHAKDINILDTVRENFNARRTFKSAVSAVKAMNRLRAQSLSREKVVATSAILPSQPNLKPHPEAE